MRDWIFKMSSFIASHCFSRSLSRCSCSANLSQIALSSKGVHATIVIAAMQMNKEIFFIMLVGRSYKPGHHLQAVRTSLKLQVVKCCFYKFNITFSFFRKKGVFFCRCFFDYQHTSIFKAVFSSVIEFGGIGIPPQECCLLIGSAQCRDAAVVYNIHCCRACRHQHT